MGIHHHNHSSHGHSHSSHDHGSSSEKSLLIVLSLTLTFMVVEYIGGWFSNSLALISDASHMLTDSAALLLAYISLRVGKIPRSQRHTFGWRRAEIIGAFCNGIFLLGLAFFIVFEAWERFQTPKEINATVLLGIAGMGLVVNLIAASILMKGEKDSMALRGALLHVFGDVLGSIGALIAGGLILWKGWLVADVFVSVAIALIISYSAFGFVRDSIHIMLQGVPAHINIKEIEKTILNISGVRSLHDLHIWSLTQSDLVLTVHIISDWEKASQLVTEVTQEMRKVYGISHSTIQLETSDSITECDNCD